MYLDASSQIGTLHARRCPADTPAVRASISNLLNGVDWHPAGMPPSAILIVRRLKGLPAAQATLGHPSVQARFVWERALQQSILQQYQRAARPAQGDSALGREAVVFSDLGEMLACYVLDACSQRVQDRWWWQIAARNLGHGLNGDIETVLKQNVRYLPAALGHITQRGQIDLVMKSLSPAAARGLLQALTQSFGVGNLELDNAQQLSSEYSNRQGPYRDDLDGIDKPALVDDSPSKIRREQSNSSLQDYLPAFSGDTPIKTPTQPPNPDNSPQRRSIRQTIEARSLETARGIRNLFSQKSLMDDSKPDHAQTTRSTGLDPRDQGEYYPAHPAPPRYRSGSHFITQHEQADLDQQDHIATAPAPWEDWIPTPLDLDGLSKEQACLLVVALSLDTKPGVLRQPDFISALQLLWNHSERVKPKPGPPDRKVPPMRASETIKSSSTQSFDTGRHSPRSKEVSIEQNDRLSAVPDRCPISSKEMVPVSVDPKTEPAPENQCQLVTPESPSIEVQSGVCTQLGGILYLINLMQQLDLPDCFAADLGIHRQLGSWEWVDLLGRSLLGEQGDAYLDDPIWDLLTRLDGRDPEISPGPGFIGKQKYNLPTTWHQLSLESTVAWYWNADGKRIRIWSDREYIVLDHPKQMGGEPSEIQARTALRDYLIRGGLHKSLARKTLSQQKLPEAPLEEINGMLLTGLNQDLTWWLERVLPAIRVCLREMLRMESHEQDELSQTLLLVPGTIYTTQTHVDLVTSLEAISLPVRLAGLDFDLGWLPEFGRVVKFHFR